MSTVVVTVLGGAADGRRMAVPEAEIVSYRHVEIDDEPYTLTTDLDRDGLVYLRFVLDGLDKSSRKGPQPLYAHALARRAPIYRTTIAAVKLPYTNFLRLGFGLVKAAELCGVSYAVLLQERRFDGAFDIVCRLARAEGRGR